MASPGRRCSDTSSIRRSEYIRDAAVAVRGLPRRLLATIRRTVAAVLFVARAGMAALDSIDILVYESPLATEN
jgi:hypothetical protein